MKKKYKIYKLETKSHDNGWKDRYYTIKFEQDNDEHWNEFDSLELAEAHLQTLLKPWSSDEFVILPIYSFSESAN